jgi:hypothetical protein
MKTAMQELIEWTNQYQGKMISADQVVLQAHNLLEKEKEQIIDAYINGFPDDWESDKRIRYAKEYYNMNYNQNK